MKLAAKEMGSIKALKETLKKGGGSGSAQYIKNVPADGITVRFLTEPEQWFGYDEYWNDEAKNFVPMAEGEILPDGARRSFRYLTVALDVEADRVIPLKLPKTAANSLILKYDKYDTMMDRNYELEKHGEGLDTTYEVTPEAPSKMNLAKYELLDLEAILLAARRMALGEDDIVSGSSTATFAEDDIDDDTDDDTDIDTAVDEAISDDAPALKAAAAKPKKIGAPDVEALFPDDDFRTDYNEEELAQIEELGELEDLAGWWECDANITAILLAQEEENGTDDDDDDDDEDEDDESDADDDTDDSADDDDEAVEYDEDELRGMSVRALRVIANDLGLSTRGLAKDDLVDAIIEASED